MINPLSNIVFLLIFDVTTHLGLGAITSIQSRSASLSSTLIHVIVTISGLGKFLKDQQSGKTLRAAEGSLKNSRVNSCAVQEGPMDFETTTAVFGETILIRW